MKVTTQTINKRNLFLVFGVMALLLVSSVSGYYCIQEEDNDAVKEFKSNMNTLALQHDIEENGLTEEVFNIKLKYFHPCKEW